MCVRGAFTHVQGACNVAWCEKCLSAHFSPAFNCTLVPWLKGVGLAVVHVAHVDAVPRPVAGEDRDQVREELVGLGVPALKPVSSSGRLHRVPQGARKAVRGLRDPKRYYYLARVFLRCYVFRYSLQFTVWITKLAYQSEPPPIAFKIASLVR